MIFTTHSNVRKFFILGAGASVDYGLPTWDQLADILRGKILSAPKNTYQYKDDMLNWLSLTGSNSKYDTIDRCIEKESLLHIEDKGHEVENQLFSVMKDAFEEITEKNVGSGWINILNRKILKDRELRLEQQIAFINYNYDDILEAHFLTLSDLREKERRFMYKKGLAELSEAAIDVLYPHGNFYTKRLSGRLLKHVETMKSEDLEHIDAVSCYDSSSHTVGTSYPGVDISLYLLGLGSGLRVNLGNINFINGISDVHVTVRQDKNKAEVVSFLSRYCRVPKERIQVYKDCQDLINQCF